MTAAARGRWQVRAPLLIVSAGAWIDMLAHRATNVHRHHGLASVAPFDWLLMIAAMMAPLLMPAVAHVRLSSFPQRRARSITMFLFGYLTVWSALRLVLLLLWPYIYSSPSLLLAAALAWQFSPMKQYCLNHCHAHPALPAFGYAADAGALRFGLSQGLWCAGSCWLLMVLPLLVEPSFHIPAMAGVTLFITAERLERPMPARWQVRVPMKAMRLVLAQARVTA